MADQLPLDKVNKAKCAKCAFDFSLTDESF